MLSGCIMGNVAYLDFDPWPTTDWKSGHFQLIWFRPLFLWSVLSDFVQILQRYDTNLLDCHFKRQRQNLKKNFHSHENKSKLLSLSSTVSLYECHQSHQKCPLNSHLKPPKLHHQWITTVITLTEGGQQYPCSQKDAEECFSRPHTPLPPSTHDTLPVFTPSLQKIFH